MTIADLLTFAGIVVSIFFGYVVTHFSSIRDTRTRVVKDYYLSQVKDVKKKVDAFFHNIAFGKSSFRRVMNWYNHIIIDVKDIDQGVRKSLDLQIEDLSNLIDTFYWEITSWEDFNDQYSLSSYSPTNEHRERLLQMKSEMDAFLNKYVCHVNQANNYPIWTIQIQRIKQSTTFYRSQEKKYPGVRACFERFEKHIWEIALFVGILILGVIFFKKLEWEKKHDLLIPLENISNKQDSIYKVIRVFKDKYEPVEIHNKTFNNSTFFNADQIDSVQIKLFQTLPKTN